MRLCALIFVLLFSAHAFAHDVSGTVEVLLKGDKKKNDLSSVIVYLDSAGNESKISADAMKKNYTMATKNKQILPRSLAIPVGATVQFPNFDSIFHNLFSVSSPNQFDLGFYKGGDSKTQAFQHAGVVKVFCNVHPQMTATIIVTATSYSTVADEKGNFNLGNIPNGNYQLKAYTEEGQAVQNVMVGDQPLSMKLTIDARNFKKLRHKNKFGKEYSTDENERY